MKKKILLLLAISVFALVLGGCCNCSSVCPTICTITVESKAPTVWGWLVQNGEPTGEYIGKFEKVTIDGPCGQMVTLWLEDNCGYKSHQEVVYIQPGNNVVQFDFWTTEYDDYWYYSRSRNFNEPTCHCSTK